MMNLKCHYTIYSVVLLLFVSLSLQAQYKNDVSNYITAYRDIAITEMDRTGIPASIKLAQGILESGAGKSELAKNANNHFGIKCGKDWSGTSYALEDDDFDTTGTLTKSCFRVYTEALESYIDHSEFLRNPSKYSRYGFLFTLDRKDYKAWANGLKKAGYATNPKYADLLIRMIEDYKLYQYDGLNGEDILASTDGATPLPPAYSEKDAKKQRHTNKLVSINDVKVVLVRDGSSLNEIAEQYDISVKRLKEYNLSIKSANADLNHDSKVFLQPRRTGFRGKNKWHYIKEGETVATVAEMYAIKEASLLRRNQLKPKEEPAIGERLALRGWGIFNKKPTLRSEKKSILPKKPTKALPQDTDKTLPPAVDTKPDPNSQTKALEQSSIAVTNPSYHIVEKGDTLYKLSRQYNISVDTIKQLNAMTDENIKLGQELRVK